VQHVGRPTEGRTAGAGTDAAPSIGRRSHTPTFSTTSTRRAHVLRCR
jgi:hypothetical protein